MIHLVNYFRQWIEREYHNDPQLTHTETGGECGAYDLTDKSNHVLVNWLERGTLSGHTTPLHEYIEGQIEPLQCAADLDKFGIKAGSTLHSGANSYIVLAIEYDRVVMVYERVLTPFTLGQLRAQFTFNDRIIGAVL